MIENFSNLFWAAVSTLEKMLMPQPHGPVVTVPSAGRIMEHRQQLDMVQHRDVEILVVEWIALLLTDPREDRKCRVFFDVSLALFMITQCGITSSMSSPPAITLHDWSLRSRHGSRHGARATDGGR